MSPISAALLHRQHLEAVHHCLERLHRIDLGNDHVRAHALGASGETAAAPAVAGDHELAPGEQLVRRANDAVDRRLAGSIAVVEEVLRLRLVDRDDREAERAVALERLQADDARRRLFRAADHVAELLAAMRVQDADHIGAVVHRDLRLVVDCGLDVRVVRVVVLAVDREDRDVVLLDERRCDIVLRRERIRRAEHDVGAAGLQRASEVRRLGRHVQAGRNAVSGQRLFALEALADRREHGHVAVGPLDPANALLGEPEILDVVSARCSHQSFFRSLGESSDQAASSLSCFRCSQSSASMSAPWSQVSTAARRAGSRRRRAAKATSPNSTAKRRRSSRSACSWLSSRSP